VLWTSQEGEFQGPTEFTTIIDTRLQALGTPKPRGRSSFQPNICCRRSAYLSARLKGKGEDGGEAKFCAEPQ
jgi:hypothetical protein